MRSRTDRTAVRGLNSPLETELSGASARRLIVMLYDCVLAQLSSARSALRRNDARARRTALSLGRA